MTPSQPWQAQPPSPRSLAVASLDVGRVLADRDGVTFRAQGTCMYPTVRPRDVLRIRSCAATEVAVGDIAVCRTPAYLFAHRVINTGKRDGHAFIITRPDRSRRGRDAPTFEDDLLGVVVSITRAGVPVALTPTAYPWVTRCYLSACLALVEAEPGAHTGLIAAAAHVQDRQLYRRFVGRWFSGARSGIRFAVRVPLNATLGDAVFRELAPGEFDSTATLNSRAVDRWTVAAYVNNTGAPAGSVTVARGRDGGWQVEESHVRARYRGTCLDDVLLQQAEAILARGGQSFEGAGQ